MKTSFQNTFGYEVEEEFNVRGIGAELGTQCPRY
jgi:hypothetical protein